MIEKVTILRVSTTDTKKDGTPLVGKYGPYFRVGIQTKEHGDKWLNGFSGKLPTWQEGDEVDLDITTEEWQGKEQLKFRIPKAEDLKDAEIARLKAQVAGKVDDVNTDEIKAEDIPFD